VKKMKAEFVKRAREWGGSKTKTISIPGDVTKLLKLKKGDFLRVTIEKIK